MFWSLEIKRDLGAANVHSPERAISSLGTN